MTQSRDQLKGKPEEVLRLLERHRMLESLAERQQTERRDLLAQMQRRENLAELERYLRGTHPADLASILSSLDTNDRLLVFSQLSPKDAGQTLVELDEEVRAAIIDGLAPDALAAAVSGLDADDLAYLAPSLPDELVRKASEALGAGDRSWVFDAGEYPEDVVGRLMRRDVVFVRADQTVGEAIATLRSGAELPSQTDRLFVIDARHMLKGGVLLQNLIRADPDTPMTAITQSDIESCRPDEHADRIAKVFERYDLVSAPVVDDLGKLVGRVTIDAVVDYLRQASQRDALARAGLRGAEDLFAPVSESVRNRWPWLAINLFTAFAASRVIGVFEGTISRVAALAALMPIVASIGGNTGNQTVALVIRALALDQLRDTEGRLMRKELVVGAVNGLTWGLLVGVVTLVLYRSFGLSLVMAAAIFLNLVVAALAGVAVPFLLRWVGRDPAHGSSVVLTFVTDGMGFFLFLGLAHLWLG